jgi:hypothetical protein
MNTYNQQSQGSPISSLISSQGNNELLRVVRRVPGGVIRLIKEGSEEMRDRLVKGLTKTTNNRITNDDKVKHYRMVVQSHSEHRATVDSLNEQREKQAGDRRAYRRNIEWENKIKPAYTNYVKR